MLIFHSADAVLRAEQRHQLELRRVFQEVYRGVPLPVMTGVIGYEANTQTLQGSKILFHQHIDPLQRLTECIPLKVGCRARCGLVKWCKRSADVCEIEIRHSLGS